MAKVKTPADRWVAEALKALATGGPEAVRVEAIAAALGVSKGGFYWHFSSRGELLEQALDVWEQTVVEDVIAEIEPAPGDARDKLRALFRTASASASAFGGRSPELAIREWARRDRSVARRLRRVDDRRMEFLHRLFAAISADEEDAEARSLVVYSLFVAQRFIPATRAAAARTKVMQRALERLLE